MSIIYTLNSPTNEFIVDCINKLIKEIHYKKNQKYISILTYINVKKLEHIVFPDGTKLESTELKDKSVFLNFKDAYKRFYQIVYLIHFTVFVQNLKIRGNPKNQFIEFIDYLKKYNYSSTVFVVNNLNSKI